MDAGGQLYVNGTKTSFENLKQEITNALQENPSLQAMISADEKTPHGLVVNLIDAIRKNGIKDFAIQVEVEGT